MATDINTLKSWFETGDKPTQEQFWAWIDSYWHKSEGIPVSAVSGLGNLISGKADSSQLQYYAKTDASNIDVNVWKVKLLPSNIATVDNNDLTGNVYDKSQCDNLFYKMISDPGDSKIYLLGVDGKSVCLNDIICDLVSTCLLPPVDVTDCPNSSVTFTLNPTPSDAIVTLNGVIQKTITVDSGTDVTYKVERDGYFPKTDTINVTENKILAVELPPVLDNTLLQFKVKTTQLNERVPIALLRTSDTEGVSLINYGDGIEQLVTVPIYNGSESWTDSQGETHYVDTGNTFYHDYKNPGEYTVTIKTGANIGYIRLCESLTQGVDGYMKPSENKYITEVSKFKSDSLTNLDYTFAGLSNAVLSPDFKLEAPEVTTMNATFYGFGISTEIKSFPAMMLSKITKPTALRGTFFRCGVKQILPSFLDSFADLVSVWELFKNSKLGNGFYSGVDAGQFPNIAVNGTNDFIPVSLFWKNPKLKEISHCFNYIGEGFFGNLTSGYLAYFVIRRELFWNGKEAGNATGTIENAFYAFAKCNRVICEPNLLKHAPNMVHIGGLFTQTNQTMHPVGWATIIPVAASETEIYQFAESGGNYTATPVAGKGLTFDLRVMFPDVSYPNIKTLNGAFTVAATGGNMGFQHPIDYTPNGLPAKLDLSMSGADFLSKFPNAKADSVDASAKIILGQSGGTDQEKSDGRNGVFYMLDQDTRISDKATVPALLFNNAIPY